MDIKHLQFSFRMYWALNAFEGEGFMIAAYRGLPKGSYSSPLSPPSSSWSISSDSNIRPMSPICWKPAGFISCWLSLPGYRSGIF